MGDAAVDQEKDVSLGDAEEDEEEYVDSEEDNDEEASGQEEEERPKVSRKPAKEKPEKKRRSAFIDDAAEEDEEDPKRLKRSRFIDDIAEVEDDDEDDDEEEEGLDDLIDDAGEVPDATDVMEVRRAMREAELQAAKDDELNPEELEKYLKERFGRERVAAYAADETEAGDTAVMQQALMPTARDPKLWVVRCAEGAEREIITCLLQKCYDYAAKGKPLMVKAAFCKDNLKGYIYIEAHKETHVREALSGLRSIFHSKAPRMVPLTEMVEAVTVAKSETRSIHPGAWIRMRAGLYKGDLGKVVDVDVNAGKATVKLIPRLDYVALANRDPKEARQNFGKQPKVRPQPRPFNHEDAKAHQLDVSITRDRATGFNYYVLNNNNRFHQGYLVKTAAVKSLVLQTEIPPLDELQRFQAAQQDENRAANNDLDSLVESLQNDGLDLEAAKVAQFKVGDRVIAIDGDLQNAQGTVEHVSDEGSVLVRLADKTIKDLVTFPAKELVKFFETGDHVKVIKGRHEGETGMVVAVDGGVATLFTDATKMEIKVFTRDLVEAVAVASSLDTIGEYELFDLVSLDPTTVGVIVGVEKDSCQVMTNQGRPDKPDIRICRLPDIKKRLNDKRLTVIDSTRNEIQSGDLVEVIDGPLRNRTGTAIHVMRGFVFLQSRDVPDHSGFSVIQSRMCKVKGGQNRMIGVGGNVMATPSRVLASPFPYMQGGAVPQSPAPFAARDGPRTMGAGQQFSGRVTTQQDKLLVGKPIEIRQGPYRGMRGRIKAATQTHLRVELEAQNRIVTVDRNHVPGVGGGAAPMPRPYQNPYMQQPAPPVGRTPAHYTQGSATPAHWTQTGMTPMHPGMTPNREGTKTPAYDPAWMMTPAHPGIDGGNDAGYNTGAVGSFMPVAPSTTAPPSQYLPGTSRANDSYVPSPAVHGTTPNFAFSPPAPTGQYNPSLAAQYGTWVGLEVVLADGTHGIMQSLDATGSAQVTNMNGANAKAVTAQSLRLAPVSKGDTVRLVSGDEAGAEGVMMTAEGAEYVVKLNAAGGGRVVVAQGNQVGRIRE